MTGVLPYLIGLFMACTLLVLFAGLVSFAFGDRNNRHLATKLMTARVALQGIAVALFGVLVLFSVN